MWGTFLNRRTLIAGLALCLVGTGVWGVWRGRTQGIPALGPTPAEVLATIPQATRNSPADQAIAQWTAKARQAAGDDSAWTQLGDALMQKARETADASYYGRADAVFRKALLLQPDNVAALIGVAWVYSARHEFERSIEWANKAIGRDPHSQEAYGLLGDAALEMGQYDTAFVSYQKMLDLRPDLSSYSRGAQLLYVTGDLRKAIWLMQKAIAAGAPYAENTAWCRAQLALMHLSNGVLLAAEQGLQTALKQTPNNYHVLAALGKVKAAQKEYGAAIEYYKQAIAVAPQHEALVALGDLYLITGHQQEAEKQYALVETIHKLNQANGVRGDMQMARFYADHDRNIAAALREAAMVYQTRPNVFAADTLAWCYYKNGRYQEAQKFIAKALGRRTPDATILFHAGLIYAKLDNRRAAQQYLYQALSLNPNFHPLYASVAADTLKQLGEHGPERAQVRAE